MAPVLTASQPQAAMEPRPTRWKMMARAVLVADFVGRQEFDGGTERVADSQAKVGGDPAAEVRRLPGRGAGPPAYRGVAGDQFSGPKHFAYSLHSPQEGAGQT